MKTIRYVPIDGRQRVTVTLRETDELVVVPSDGFETSDAATQRGLDANPSVRREAKKAAKPPKAPAGEGGQQA